MRYRITDTASRLTLSKDQNAPFCISSTNRIAQGMPPRADRNSTASIAIPITP